MENRINSIVLTENNELIYDISVFNPEFKLEWASLFPRFSGKEPFILVMDDSYNTTIDYLLVCSESQIMFTFNHYATNMKIILKF